MVKCLKAGQDSKTRDSRQFLQLPALVMLLAPETLVVTVELLQLELLLLVTTETKTGSKYSR